jgi:hypothetical protein
MVNIIPIYTDHFYILPDPDSMSTGTKGREPLLMGMFTGLERAGRDPEPTPTSTASSSSNDNGTLKNISNVNHILYFEGRFNMKLISNPKAH